MASKKKKTTNLNSDDAGFTFGEAGQGDSSVPNVEKNTAAEMKGFNTGLAQSFEKEKERFRLATESDFYICLVFQSQAQRDEFIKKAKWMAMVYDGRWVDGMELAEKMGIKLENGLLNWNLNNSRINQRLASLVETDEEVFQREKKLGEFDF